MYSTPLTPVETAGDSGAVITQRRVAADAGAAMFRLGGNALDAAVAAALVAGVVEPAETTLAGSGFMLLHDPELGTISIEFGPQAPAGVDPGMFPIADGAKPEAMLGIVAVEDDRNTTGGLASGVPRTLAALVEAQERFGLLPRTTVIAPAVAAAERGFAPDPFHHVATVVRTPALLRSAAARATFLDDRGAPVGVHDMAHAGVSFGTQTRVRQPALAATLRRVADHGRAELERGDTARHLVATSQRAGGTLTLDDLAGARADVGAPRTASFLGSTVAVPRAPCGALTELQILKVWARSPIDHSHGTSSREGVDAFIGSAVHAFADRYHWLGDPGMIAVPEAQLLADPYVSHLADPTTDIPMTGGVDPWIHFASHRPHGGSGLVSGPTWTASTATAPTSGTTHVSAADRRGQVVAITHTAANHFGSAVMCAESGLLLDASMAWFNAVGGAANSIRPGARPLANMGPAIVIGPDQSAVALGASGGRRIISAVAQGIVNTVTRGLGAALETPRAEASGGTVVLDDRCPVGAGEAFGLPIQRISAPVPLFSIDLARMSVAGTRGGRPYAAIDSHCFS